MLGILLRSEEFSYGGHDNDATGRLSARLVSEVQHDDDFLNRHFVMGGNTFQDSVKRAGFYRGMIRNDFVVLAHLFRRHPDMRTFLPRGLISQLAQCPNQIRA
jgi:hypothetical protein